MIAPINFLRAFPDCTVHAAPRCLALKHEVLLVLVMMTKDDYFTPAI
jgi:hypothetical protein